MRPEIPDLPETQAIKVFLAGLKKHVDFKTLQLGFHAEREAFLEVTNILKMFCTSITLNAQTYYNEDLDYFGVHRKKLK